jgi:hypothetical protein
MAMQPAVTIASFIEMIVRISHFYLIIVNCNINNIMISPSFNLALIVLFSVTDY